MRVSGGWCYSVVHVCCSGCNAMKNVWLPVAILVAGIAVLTPATVQQEEDIPHTQVQNWALKFGVDLWEFGRMFTYMDVIERRYLKGDIRVTRKDTLMLIREMAAEVKNMMDIKMNAVMRIMDSAEQAALSHRFDPGLVTRFFNSRRLNSPDADGVKREVTLSLDRHFDQLSVNASLSAVLMPAGIRESDPDVMNGIKWSEYLDPLFVNNYEMDPSLSWQYFGSSTGFLRRYPATKWPPDESVYRGLPMQDAPYDFRSSAWYVNAATSPKDIVILIDGSGSMTGLRREISKAVVIAILDTLGDNDFVNVFRFSETIEELVPCFKDLLVQANAENIRELKQALNTMKPENIANFTSALVTGFEILHKYNRTGQGCQCNQAIMLVTDGAPYSYRDVFKQYNWPHMPVRVFTYLVGTDTSSASEMRWMACANKGYYTRINSPGEAREKVLKYVSVMARPMVMYQNDHPIQWTPVYSGGMGNTFPTSDPEEEQLMTSVSTPIFDRRNHSERSANLLGVVGTDVPVNHIKKLLLPYKIGVNGYPFIVNNNGHVLFHPDLRPLKQYGTTQYQSSLRPHYQSVDLTEVELVDTDLGPRENNTVLLDLRHDMIDQKEGETELTVKIHYDNMRRVSTRRHKYFYNPIEDTPFSLGIAIPEGYGMYELLAEMEIKHAPVNVSQYFKKNNWKVHPDWIYCEYNYASEHQFDSPEEQIEHFLVRTGKPGWKWMSMRPRSPIRDSTSHTTTKKLERDSYFCDKTLMQSLVFDAAITEDFGQKLPMTFSDRKGQANQIFGAQLSFIATRSGLLRWHDHNVSGIHNCSTHPEGAHPENEYQLPHFSESNRRAIDEIWYKRAVDQYMVEQNSFVYSVPFDVGDTPGTVVTATHAVFVEHKGYKAPVAVVGLQLNHAMMSNYFLNLTATCNNGCRKNCFSDDLDCYILDNNGFVLISEAPEHTGRFFGLIDGTIMDSLVQDRIYKKVPVYDYQGACPGSDNPYSAASTSCLEPLQPLKWFARWIFGKMLWWAAYSGLVDIPWVDATPQPDDDYFAPCLPVDGHYSGEDEEDVPFDKETDEIPGFPGGAETDTTGGAPSAGASPPHQQTPSHTSSSAIPQAPKYNRSGVQMRPCDKRVDLYVLQPDRLSSSGKFNPLKGKLTNCHESGCERPFSVQKIQHSNMVLLVVDTLCNCRSKQINIGAQEVSYDTATGAVITHCRPRPHESLYRRRPPKCLNYHPEEIEIKVCGAGWSIRAVASVIWSLAASMVALAIAT